MQRVLVISAGIFHPVYPARRVLQGLLLRQFPATGYQFVERSSLECLPAYQSTDRISGSSSQFSAIVLYIHHKKISEQALAALDNFIQQGGGLLAIHSATASFKASRHYFEILGGRFTGHAKVQWLDIEPGAGENRPFDGLPAFCIRDELYLHELQPEVNIHFCVNNNGKNEPVVWTRNYGAGRVCYLSAGHTASSLRHPVVQAILQRGLKWVVHGVAN